MTSYLDQIDAAPAEQKAAVVGSFLQGDPRPFFAELRAKRPIVVVPGIAVVSKFRDVQEVLERQGDFTVLTYAPKMARATGEFFLGMQDSPEYQVEVSIARLAARRDDLARIQKFVQTEAAAVLASAECRRLDIVPHYSRYVPSRLVQDYFGATGTSAAQIMNWIRPIFYDLFTNLGDDPTIRQAALDAAVPLREHIDSLIAQAKTVPPHALPDTVLNRFVRLQAAPPSALDDVGVRRNFCGLILGAVETTSRCVATVIDYFLSNPALLEEFRKVVQQGDRDLIAKWVFEALRFNPQAPFLYRLTLQEVALAKSTPYAVVIPAGTMVFAGTWSAMLDDEELTDPGQFSADRPAYHYMHFGHGMHECFGRYINWVQVPELVAQVLSLPGIRRAPGEEGQLVMAGPFPDRLILEWD